MANPWDEVYDHVRVIGPANRRRAPLPTDAELDAVETQLGSRLPQSYREFMRRFGVGTLSHQVEFDRLSPSGRDIYDIVGHTRQWRKYVEQWPRASWFAQLVCFAAQGTGGEWYCWDSSTASERDEYPCYCLPHGREHRPVAAGNTFWEFVAWIHSGLHQSMDAGVEPEPAAEIAFLPDCF